MDKRLLSPLLTCWIGLLLVDGAAASDRSSRPPLLANSGATAPRLLGTVVHAQAERSLAVLSVVGQSAQTLHVGDDVGAGLRLEAIANDYVVVTRGTQRYALPLSGQAGTARTRAASASGPTGTIKAAANETPARTASPQLRANDISDVRAACADASLMQALPAGQKAELDALGVCTPH
ncbi:type II secretion system protein N [Stenotrophomonas sp.]|uniref:type II secretion system protein N n=1 Tax=Stenotrophomonas sp. TaxID=69392 RepID=UPI0028B1FAE5|nr:type II secretion system protein N [Stenotrophomonas sp.]